MLKNYTQILLSFKFICAVKIVNMFLCTGDKPWDTDVILGSWYRGELYMTSILEVIKIVILLINV